MTTSRHRTTDFFSQGNLLELLSQSRHCSGALSYHCLQDATVFTTLFAAMSTSESPAYEGCQMPVTEHKQGMERLTHSDATNWHIYMTNKT